MEDYILQIAREGLLLILVASAPPVLASLVTGLLISIFQATTQIQEQTLTFVPKLIAVFASLVIAGPWIGAQLLRFTRMLFEGFPGLF
ncbi:flagellar biosynthesis protein FliQ [Persicimonas caeni]|jgi:flagellar biosynthetic protein FliQ|uniref:Flagellar biosynthetic protein FliQ n=1 Tax=Persicimonas caeni TaxID=2292766 RepID=A0A4Y6PTJ8_PERCE|nr:flagellar biosynthesis protein FliQ [Persicimonas caeni]QDG51656.1 flagellar biosynthesis protein FliQ [Persicimonas caeni]QED32877.1 flagellar biosynthesis protein FliQ [Persicimonas caeni]